MAGASGFPSENSSFEVRGARKFPGGDHVASESNSASAMTWHQFQQPQVPPLSSSSAPPSLDQPSISGDCLLQFLRSGSGEESPAAGNAGAGEQEDAGLWHFQDPAVAALGPSHSFPAPASPLHHFGPPPPRFGPWNHFPQQQQSQPEQQHHQHRFESPFLTPSDHGFARGFPVERPFHPYSFPYVQPAMHEHSGKLQQLQQAPAPALLSPGPIYRPPEKFPDWQQVQVQQVQSSPAPVMVIPSELPGKSEKSNVQQFFGNGSELLQLLQGGGVARGRVRGDESECSTRSSSSQRGSPSTTLHGPIGPPKRQLQQQQQSVSPPQSPNDLLGRLWAAHPAAMNLGFDHLHLHHQQQHHQHPQPQLMEINVERELEEDDAAAAQVVDDVYRFCQEPEGSGGSPGFSLLKRGTGASKLPLEGFEFQDSGSSMAGVSEKQKAGARSQEGFYRGRVTNGGDVEPEEPRGNGRRRNSSGGRVSSERSSSERGSETRRSGGSSSRGSSGQWVAVNERSKEADAPPPPENNSSPAGVELRGEVKDESLKPVNGALREELKRRKKQQQEWRVKNSPDKSAEKKGDSYRLRERSLASQLEHPGLPSGSTQNSAVGSALDESKQRLHSRLDPEAVDEEELTNYVASLDLDDRQQLNGNVHREGKALELQKPKELRCRESKRFIHLQRRDLFYRPDMHKFTRQLMSVYNDLIPAEEEVLRRKKFLSKLEAVVERELPGARLFLFGSCANAFGVRNSDIDVCLTVDEEEPNKIELVKKMAAILESDNMVNVQALTHARVPIVKFTEPVTGISCDICVNNMLAVVNSKLLHDYAQIDVRLRQLAFMVKHWAKRRQVNETYRGTLSSYAYVLMCIHFLQQRKPPILPCLQEMAPTYEVRIGHIRCAYFDDVESLRDYGADNKETLGELLTAFFDYWAYRHSYNHAVISVRTGGYMSKDEKDWTRRIGNERHLICIEDPFEVSHDLGRVVDKHSIKALREEFYRAANVIASDFNPAVTVFEPYIRREDS